MSGGSEVTRVRRTALPLSGLDLTVLATDDVPHVVWTLVDADGTERLRHAASGTALLHAGYLFVARGGGAALAVGSRPAGELTVRFTSRRVRWREEATAAVHSIGHGLWCAEARGGFDLVVVSGKGCGEVVAPLRVLR
jgi:hypothetical protein